MTIVLLSAVTCAQRADISLKAYALIKHVDNMSVLLAKKDSRSRVKFIADNGWKDVDCARQLSTAV